MMKDEERILELQKNGLEELRKYGEVYYSEDFKNIRIYNVSSYRSTVKINDEDMLEFSFEMDDMPKEDIVNALKALESGKKYYLASNKGFVLLQEEPLRNLRDMLDNLDISVDELAKDKITLNKYNSLYLQDKFLNSLDNDTSVIQNEQYKNMISSIKQVASNNYVIPKELDCNLRKYQDIGFKWLKTLKDYGFGGILADEMGLGKTIQTIAFLLSERNDLPSLVVCPTSLIYNWKEEMEKFSPSLNTMILYGSKDQREELLDDLNGVDVIITSYSIVRRDIDRLNKLRFNICVIDEAQNIKNLSSLNAKTVKEIRAINRLALTGTPIENSLSELWSIFDFVMPGYLFSNSKFKEKYETLITKDNNKDALIDLNKKVSPFILRRKKKDVLKELPDKIDKKLIIDLTKEQKRLYATYVNLFKKEIEDDIQDKGLNKSKIKILSALTRLRQICCDPSTFINDYKGDSGKLNMLYEVLDGCISEGHKVLVFSQFTSVLKNIARDLRGMDIQYMYLDGAVKSQERMNMVKQFNEGDKRVFLISLKAGGAGLNLTSADVVIHFDPWWNPAVEDQATDRAHRIGQKKTVEVIKLISKGTIEEKIYKLQEKKKEIINSVMEEDAIGSSVISSMSVEDIKELFS
jgi:SNF2 family DNA or RNA helicase